jgi:hypothetical protein
MGGLAAEKSVAVSPTRYSVSISIVLYHVMCRSSSQESGTAVMTVHAIFQGPMAFWIRLQFHAFDGIGPRAKTYMSAQAVMSTTQFLAQPDKSHFLSHLHAFLFPATHSFKMHSTSLLAVALATAANVIARPHDVVARAPRLGHVEIRADNQTRGCLASNMMWTVSGDCATYKVHTVWGWNGSLPRSPFRGWMHCSWLTLW